MNFFTHIPSAYTFYLLRQRLENPVYDPDVHRLLEACFAWDVLRDTSVLQRIAPQSEQALEHLHEYLGLLDRQAPRDALMADAHAILSAWVSILYVDGGYRANGRSAWAVYDLKRDAMYSGLSHAESSTEAEWDAALQGCHYASFLDDDLTLIFTDAMWIPEQLAKVDAQDAHRWDYAWQRYRNDKLLQLYAYLSDFPIDVVWGSRELPGIHRADHACRCAFLLQR
ncbi:MAG: hypothetical protein ACO1RX_18880 [Candidatus Sericytochromatia bacterium]